MGLMARFMPGFKAPDMSPFYHDHQFISRMTGVGFQQVDSYKSHSLSHTLGWRTAIKPAEGLSLAHDKVNCSPCRGLPHQRAVMFSLPLPVSLTMACGAGKG